jgi:hypothetical protein
MLAIDLQIRMFADSCEKFDLFNDYLERIVRQHISGILNNDLRSSHALFTAKYIEQAKDDVCGDLRTLISKVAPSFYSFMKKDKIASQVGPLLRVFYALCVCVCVCVCVSKQAHQRCSSRTIHRKQAGLC